MASRAPCLGLTWAFGSPTSGAEPEVEGLAVWRHSNRQPFYFVIFSCKHGYACLHVEKIVTNCAQHAVFIVCLYISIYTIPYVHYYDDSLLGENKWKHQWCRVPMEDGSYWICDAYVGPYAGPEPAPYRHPYVN